jgi:hypothetical protein
LATKYTENELRDAIKTSISIRQAINKLGLIPAGGNYKTIKVKIQALRIDVSHFKGKGWLKGKTHNFLQETNLQEIFDGKHPIYQTSRLKKRLINEKYLKKECNKCKRKEWLDGPIPLELDHVNGNSTDHRLKNLQLLCPNCHALTETYRGKNKRKMVAPVGFEPTTPNS